MPDTSTPEEELTQEEQAFLAGTDGNRGWRLPSPVAETPPPPPPGRAGASDPGTSTDAGTDTSEESLRGGNS